MFFRCFQQFPGPLTPSDTAHLPILCWSTPHLDRPILIFKGDTLHEVYQSLWARLNDFPNFDPPLTLSELHYFEDIEGCYNYLIGSWEEDYVVPELPDVWPGLVEEEGN
jgi:hypothetical protein